MCMYISACVAFPDACALAKAAALSTLSAAARSCAACISICVATASSSMALKLSSAAEVSDALVDAVESPLSLPPPALAGIGIKAGASAEKPAGSAWGAPKGPWGCHASSKLARFCEQRLMSFISNVPQRVTASPTGLLTDWASAGSASTSGSLEDDQGWASSETTGASPGGKCCSVFRSFASAYRVLVPTFDLLLQLAPLCASILSPVPKRSS
mmetsp:Transcript_12978/g.29442  ORF Transcript_12978/g.29442 Transcript_12978/m.29442 type:complete len:214 (-) Transcript_12978:217-858(-)